MGWFWDSKPAASSVDGPANAAPLPVPVETPTPPASTSNAVADKPSRDEQADLAFQELLREFYAEESTAKEKRIQAKESPSDAQSAHVPIDISPDISPDSLYPTDMSCRSAFDYAMFCSAFGGQFVNVYRFAEYRSCDNHWGDFWLCMRTRNWPQAERAQAVREHYKKKAIKYKTGPSSEDVWEVRTEPVKDAMQGNLEELEAKIAEWKRTNPWAPDPWEQEKTFRPSKAEADLD